MDSINLSDLFGNEYGSSFCMSYDTASKLTTDDVESKIKEAINEYDSNRLFSDDILLEFFEDKIKEELNTLEEGLKRAEKKEKKANIDRFIDTIKAVYFVPHQGLTKVIWKDGTKTEVRCQDGDEYNPEAGLALCIIKYLFGNTNYYNEIFKSVFEKKANSIKKDTSVKKKEKAAPKKKRFPCQRETTGLEW
jgi:hypothetical protein